MGGLAPPQCGDGTACSPELNVLLTTGAVWPICMNTHRLMATTSAKGEIAREGVRYQDSKWGPSERLKSDLRVELEAHSLREQFPSAVQSTFTKLNICSHWNPSIPRISFSFKSLLISLSTYNTSENTKREDIVDFPPSIMVQNFNALGLKPSQASFYGAH
ncbi:uncharacterized protein BDR25DRAFT_351391 [Lindgomyces ingoldianus]|uniref:Uncharacterized protein n=1 Tax=Lindgomyces ingoldianus TaxID=673940 RepID=A0ACB6R6I4_9PLEO|nr:uncharacterized protein BDR25DRAFT_351391 [Lindgomyces ingoldianus]KAF2474903.1 hypothetical protein BDR25DRAFT_351391 [Lindgomyces ingoldianus]